MWSWCGSLANSGTRNGVAGNSSRSLGRFQLEQSETDRVFPKGDSWVMRRTKVVERTTYVLRSATPQYQARDKRARLALVCRSTDTRFSSSGRVPWQGRSSGRGLRTQGLSDFPYAGDKTSIADGAESSRVSSSPEDTVMLEEFSLPLSSHDKLALAQPPLSHYSSDYLPIEYWTAPAAIAAPLPPGRVPDAKSNGCALFGFLHQQRGYVLPTSTWSVWTTADEIIQVASSCVH